MSSVITDELGNSILAEGSSGTDVLITEPTGAFIRPSYISMAVYAPSDDGRWYTQYPYGTAIVSQAQFTAALQALIALGGGVSTGIQLNSALGAPAATQGSLSEASYLAAVLQSPSALSANLLTGALGGYDGVIEVSGGDWVNGAGQNLSSLLQGANLQGLDSSSAQGYSPWYGQAMDPVLAIAANWAMNCVRVPLNAASFLAGTTLQGLTCTNLNSAGTGWNGSPRSPDPGSQYVAAVDNVIALAQQAGCYVWLDLHWDAPQFTFNGVTSQAMPLGQAPFISASLGLPFWKAIAARYGTQAAPQVVTLNSGVTVTLNNAAIVFELYNEPYIDELNTYGNNAATWALMKNGGSVSYWSSAYYDYGAQQTTTGGGSVTVNQAWTAAGYQQCGAAIRALGAKNVIQCNGCGYANAPNGYASFMFTDSLSPPQVAVGQHTYADTTSQGVYGEVYPNVYPATGSYTSSWDVQGPLLLQANNIPMAFTEDGGYVGPQANDAYPGEEPHTSYMIAYAQSAGIPYFAWTLWPSQTNAGLAANANSTNYLLQDLGTQAPTQGQGEVTFLAYTKAKVTAAPVISPAASGNTYTTSFTVTISDSTPGAQIVYTINGTTPVIATTAGVTMDDTAASLDSTALTLDDTAAAGSSGSPGGAAPYSFTLSAPSTGNTVTVEAMAYVPGGTYANSGVSSVTYTFGTVAALAITTPAFPSANQNVAITSVQQTASGGTAPYTWGTNPSGLPTGLTETAAGVVAGTPVGSGNYSWTQTVSDSSSPVKTATANQTMSVAAEGTVATPTISPNGGSFTATQTVTVGDATAGVTLYYTTDGSTPTTSSTKYTAPFSVSASETVKVLGVKAGMLNSAVATATFTITTSTQPTVATPTAGLTNGATYVGLQQCGLFCSTSGAQIYYTTNGTTPTPTTGTAYTGEYVHCPYTQLIQFMATLAGYNNSAVGSVQIYIQAEPVTFSVPTGSYTGAQTQTLTSASGGTIYYTTDNSTPSTSSTAYTAPFTISASETVNAIAVVPGLVNSAVSSASVTITGGSVVLPGVVQDLELWYQGMSSPGQGGGQGKPNTLAANTQAIKWAQAAQGTYPLASNNIYRTTNGGTEVLYKNIPLATSYVDTAANGCSAASATPNSQGQTWPCNGYLYRVTAVDSKGNEGPKSAYQIAVIYKNGVANFLDHVDNYTYNNGVTSNFNNAISANQFGSTQDCLNITTGTNYPNGQFLPFSGYNCPQWQLWAGVTGPAAVFKYVNISIKPTLANQTFNMWVEYRRDNGSGGDGGDPGPQVGIPNAAGGVAAYGPSPMVVGQWNTYKVPLSGLMVASAADGGSIVMGSYYKLGMNDNTNPSLTSDNHWEIDNYYLTNS